MECFKLVMEINYSCSLSVISEKYNRNYVFSQKRFSSYTVTVYPLNNFFKQFLAVSIYLAIDNLTI